MPLFTELPRETVRKGAKVVIGDSISLVARTEMGLLGPVLPTFEVPERGLSGLFGPFQKGPSRKLGFWCKVFSETSACRIPLGLW